MNASHHPATAGTEPVAAAAPKPLVVVPIEPPPTAQRVRRDARFAPSGERRTRYSMPEGLDSASSVGYRQRVSMDRAEAEEAVQLLSLTRPAAFEPCDAPITEGELFEECALGILSARQSTNYRGHRQATLGPQDSRRVYEILGELQGLEAPPLEHAAHTHFVFSRPYRTPFTLLLTFIGHYPVVSAVTVPIRGLRKRFQHIVDIPTISYLQQLHVGVLADGMERAAVIASEGRRRAQVFMAPFVGNLRRPNARAIRALEDIAGLSLVERGAGWRLALVAQVGQVPEADRVAIRPATCRKLGANLVALRSERIQPGVNQEKKAPDAYHHRQDMDVPDELTVQCGRAAYNAFAHWTGIDRERSKDLLLLDRIDVLTPDGKTRLRQVREMLDDVTAHVVRGIPLWANLMTGYALKRNAARGAKAFALAGQRIYFGGLDRGEIEAQGLDWLHAIRALGAAAARSALFAELMGCVDLPEDCDLLAGICLMAGPVNQNDIGKQFYGHKDVLRHAYPDKNPTSMLVWTLKAKTIADPIGNEEQLLNREHKGALVDLRPGPHEVVYIKSADGDFLPMRLRAGKSNTERAFGDVGNFVTDPDGSEIPGNRGERWPSEWRDAPVW